MQASCQGCKAGGGVAVGGQYEFLAIDEAARAGIRHHDAHDQAREGEQCHDRESPEHVAASEGIVTSPNRLGNWRAASQLSFIELSFTAA
jgi:hypothetical protein